MVAVRVPRQDRVDRRHPRVEARGELAMKRLVAAECFAGHLGEHRRGRPGESVRRGRPLDDAPGVLGPAPRHAPHAHALDAPRLRPGPDEVVADFADGRPGLSVELERRDQELRRRDGAKGLERPAELDGKRPSVERELLRQRRAASDAERSATAVGPGGGSVQPPATEAGRQQPVGDARGSAGARLQLLPELAEPSLELERFALVRERIVARGHVLQERLEQLGAGEHWPVVRGRGARRRSDGERKE